MTAAAIPWPELFAAHRRYLWSVCYRMTGDPLDAEDLVQATFERALARPPEDLDRPWRPWLTRVATNLAIDLLRRRSHAAYDGPWLPGPVEELLEVEDWTRTHGPDADSSDAEHRYGQLESARLAVLLALEALDPRARAVVVLRDVLGYSGPEAAECLDLTPANVRVILHRARKQLAQANAGPRAGGAEPEPDPRIEAAIVQFMTALASRDTASLERLLAADVRAVSDAGGEFLAARKIVHGPADVVALILGIGRGVTPIWAQLRRLNGEPALVVALPQKHKRGAPRGVLRVELDADGKIVALEMLFATRKLAGVQFSAALGSSASPSSTAGS